MSKPKTRIYGTISGDVILRRAGVWITVNICGIGPGPGQYMATTDKYRAVTIAQRLTAKCQGQIFDLTGVDNGPQS